MVFPIVTNKKWVHQCDAFVRMTYMEQLHLNINVDFLLWYTNKRRMLMLFYRT